MFIFKESDISVLVSQALQGGIGLLGYPNSPSNITIFFF